MHRKLLMILSLVVAVSIASTHPNLVGARAEANGDPDAIHYAGSALLTLMNIPFKLGTCVFGQGSSAVAYVLTAGVPGNYEEGPNGPETNGREIGEVGSGSCSGPWVIEPSQVQEDYSGTDELDQP